jgi:hypothetical protein
VADTQTTNLALVKPEVGSSADTWGDKLNADLDVVDGLFDTGPVLRLAKGGTGAADQATARTNLGLGTMAVQDAAAVSVGTLAASGAVTAAGNIGAGVTAPAYPVDSAGAIRSRAGGFIFPDGSTQASAAVGASNAYTDRAASYTAVSGSRARLTANNVTVTLPASPADGDVVSFAGLVTGCVLARNGKTIGGVAEDLALDVAPFFFVTLVYSSAASGWLIS